MEVKIAEHAGFCLGVELALEKLDYAINYRNIENVQNYNTNSTLASVATMGPIIHNPLVLNEYAKKDVKIINSIEEIEENMTVLIRAHGIPKEIEKQMINKDINIIDATCPRVKHAQLAIEKATQKTKKLYPNQNMLLLYGEQEHPEVQGLLSYSHIPYIVLSQKEDFFPIAKQLPKNIILAAQTTQNTEIYKHIINYLHTHHNGAITALETICDATHKRQESVKKLTKEVDALIVIGGKQSGNTKRLAQIARNQKISVFHIEKTDEINDYPINKKLIYGLTAGASTPKAQLLEVRDYLENLHQASSVAHNRKTL